MNVVDVKVFCVRADIKAPGYSSAGAAGMDVRVFLPNGKPVEIWPGDRVMLRTGLCFEIPVGYEGHLRARSGLGNKGIILGWQGTIDSDYRGEVRIPVWNVSKVVHTFDSGDRLAQLIIAPVARAVVHRVSDHSDLSQTERGDGGFGSTGVK